MNKPAVRKQNLDTKSSFAAKNCAHSGGSDSSSGYAYGQALKRQLQNNTTAVPGDLPSIMTVQEPTLSALHQKAANQLNCSARKIMLIFMAILTITAHMLNCSAAQAEVLQGRVSAEEESLRLPAPGRPDSRPADSPAHSLRISRQAANINAQTTSVDIAAFSGPLRGNANQDDLRAGVLKPDQFALPPQFDIGAERGSREMLLAWERWHHQLSSAIYERWSERADAAGRATLRITVTRDHHIIPALISSGGARFDSGLMSAIGSLDFNPGLEFPSGSQRQQVTFEADYIAGSEVRPGYSWVKNDVEKIHQSY